MIPTACPHCGVELRPAAYDRHERACYARPGMYDAMRAAMDDPDQPGTAISLDAYRVIARERGLPSYEFLVKQIGNWPQICTWVGLQPGRRQGYAPGMRPTRTRSEAAAIAEVEAMLEADARLRESLAVRGLEVCRVREIDGGRRVALMIR